MEKPQQPENAAKSLSFIRDDASDSDFFGPHSRIAKAVGSVIQTHDELKVIGLVGAWGSGKSTVLKLVEKYLDENDTEKRTHVFTYDAWLHQSDPPRRSFLETLIGFLIRKGLTTEPRWRIRLDQLNRQIEDTETTSTPALTTSGRFLITSLFLLPIGMSLMGHDWYSIWIPVISPKISISIFWTGIALVMLPAIIAVLIYLAWRPTWNPRNPIFRSWKKNWISHKEPHAGESILTLFMNKEIQRQKHRVIRAPDPTAIEFQQIFREIIGEVSSSKSRLVIVVDNLDRLPEAAAVDLWATIRSFFLGVRESKGEKALEALPTVVLPIDPGAIKRMYFANGDDAPDLAQAFMDKTFNLTFRVTPPVTSGWRGYLEAQMRRVFGEKTDDEWIYATGRLYEKFLGANEATPRQVNTLVNSIAVLWLQWQNEISFSTLAYFAIHKNEIEASGVLPFILIGRPDIQNFSDGWQKEVAAIYYGVPTRDASQIVLETPLTQSIKDCDAKTFTDLAGVAGFNAVFETVLDKNATTEIDPEFVANASFLLSQLQLPPAFWLTQAWRVLNTGMGNAGNWKVLNRSSIDGVGALIERSTDGDLAANIKKIVIKIAAFLPSAFEDKDFATNWAQLAARVVDGATKRNMDVPELLVPGPEVRFLEIVFALAAREDLVKRLKPQADSAAILAQLGAQLVNGDAAPTVETKLRGLLGSKFSGAWDGFVGTISGAIDNQSTAPSSVTASLECLATLDKSGSAVAKTAAQQLIGNGALLWRFGNSCAAKKSDDEALLLAMIILTDPTATVTTSPERAQSGLKAIDGLESILAEQPELAKSVEERLKAYGLSNNSSDIVEISARNAKLLPFVRRILSDRVRENRIGDLRLENVFSDLSRYLSCLDPDQHDAFLHALPRYGGFWDQFGEASIDTSTIILAESLIKLDDETGKRARELLNDKLRDFASDKWDAALQSGAQPFSLTMKLSVAQTAPLEIGEPLLASLKNAILIVLAGSDIAQKDRWLKLVEHISANGRGDLFKAVRDQVTRDENVQARMGFLQISSHQLLTEGRFGDKADDVLRYLVVPLSSLPEGRAWLQSNAADVLLWIESAHNETKGLLRERLVEKWNDESAKNDVAHLWELWIFGEKPWEKSTIPQEDSAEIGKPES